MPAPTLLDSGNDTNNVDTYTLTNTPTLTAGRVGIAIFQTTRGSNVAAIQSVTGYGLTWTFIGAQGYNLIASADSRLEAWWGYAASPTSTPPVITYPSGNLQTSLSWSIIEYDADTA